MTTVHPAMQDVFRTDPHDVAMPYRSDGVARALQAIFAVDNQHLPDDMIKLLSTLDAVAANGHRSKS